MTCDAPELPMQRYIKTESGSLREPGVKVHVRGQRSERASPCRATASRTGRQGMSQMILGIRSEPGQDRVRSPAAIRLERRLVLYASCIRLASVRRELECVSEANPRGQRCRQAVQVDRYQSGDQSRASRPGRQSLRDHRAPGIAARSTA